MKTAIAGIATHNAKKMAFDVGGLLSLDSNGRKHRRHKTPLLEDSVANYGSALSAWPCSAAPLVSLLFSSLLAFPAFSVISST